MIIKDIKFIREIRIIRNVSYITANGREIYRDSTMLYPFVLVASGQHKTLLKWGDGDGLREELSLPHKKYYYDVNYSEIHTDTFVKKSKRDLNILYEPFRNFNIVRPKFN